MRLYTFCNFYLSSIQQGIQTAHVVHELFNKYATDTYTMNTFGDKLSQWSEHHKTIIVLNGGMNVNIEELNEFFDNKHNQFPFAAFKEDTQSLGGIMTCVGIVIPDVIYVAAEMVRSRQAFFTNSENCMYQLKCMQEDECVAVNDYKYSVFEVELINRMNQCGLAK